VGASGLHGLPAQRVPLPDAHLGAARELPLGARQGAGALDLEAAQLLRPQQHADPRSAKGMLKSERKQWNVHAETGAAFKTEQPESCSRRKTNLTPLCSTGNAVFSLS